MADEMEPWRRCWRLGVVPELSTAALRALARGLAEDDDCLIQGETTLPVFRPSVRKLPVEAGCALAYAAWKGDGLKAVGEVEEYFQALCDAIDRRLDTPAGCSGFLSWHDQTDRASMRPLLLEEVQAALAGRE
jgi:hypothetical protein